MISQQQSTFNTRGELRFQRIKCSAHFLSLHKVSILQDEHSRGVSLLMHLILYLFNLGGRAFCITI